MTLFALVLASAAPVVAPAAAPSVEVSEPNPFKMSRAEIRAFNAQVGPNHPYYIRCRTITEVGSLVTAKTYCQTQQKWAATDREGNRVARDTIRVMDETRGNTAGN